jgi:hypothetical protein
MSIEEYEKSGGFREELGYMRTMGQSILSMQEALPARPHSEDESVALEDLENAHRKLHEAILKTRPK